VRSLMLKVRKFVNQNVFREHVTFCFKPNVFLLVQFLDLVYFCIETDH